jgi:hypothetical protein
MQEICPYGSVRGVPGNWHPYRDSLKPDICRRVQRQLQRNEQARFYHYRTRKCIPPRKLRL